MDDSEDGSNHDTDDCTVISNDANGALEMEEIVSYLEGAGTNYKDYLNTSVKPPVQPRGGTLILFDLGPDESRVLVKPGGEREREREREISW